MDLAEALSHLEIDVELVTKQDVKTAYRRLMQKWHPDKHTGTEDVERATRKAQHLNASYEVLARFFESHEVLSNPRPPSQPIPQKVDPKSYATRAARRSSRPSRGRRYWDEIVEHGFPDETVFEVFFESSHLVSAGYDSTHRILYQKFHSGGASTVVYRYFNVPPSIWQGLQEATSHGRYAIRNINYSYRYERCTEPNRPYNPQWRWTRS